MLNCRDATKLISESLDRKTTFVEKISLWLHTVLCGFCRRFRTNMIAIQKMVRKHDVNPEQSKINPNDSLSDEAREKIKTLIARNK